MAADSRFIPVFDPSVLGQLACPACLGGLRLDGEQLACEQCGRAYPIVDGIPVLIAGRADEHGKISKELDADS
jgi:uncharacterized protein YbaR (Trm112 family)